MSDSLYDAAAREVIGQDGLSAHFPSDGAFQVARLIPPQPIHSSVKVYY